MISTANIGTCFIERTTIMDNEQYTTILKGLSRIMNNQILIMGKLCAKEDMGSMFWSTLKDEIHGTMDCVTDLMESEEQNRGN